MRPSDTVARLGGDEFAVLLDGLESQADAVRVAERVQAELSRPLAPRRLTRSSRRPASASPSAPTGYDHAEDILRDADTAMYRAKERGKARYELFDARDARPRGRACCSSKTTCAAPSSAASSRSITSRSSRSRPAGSRGSRRWCAGSTRRAASSRPPTSSPLAEETGPRSSRSDAWVLRESCRQMRHWRASAGRPRRSPSASTCRASSSRRADLVERVEETLRETGLDPRG